MAKCKDKMVALSVRFREEDHKRMEETARKLGISTSEFIRTEILYALQHQERRLRLDEDLGRIHDASK